MAISDHKPMTAHKTDRNNLFGGGAAGESRGTENEEEDEKPRTLFVGNVPREVHKREIEEVFGEIGPLKRCYIQYPRDGNEKKRQREDTTVAYVTFALSQDATSALEKLQNTKIGNNRINIKFAKARSEQSRSSFGGDAGGRFQRSANLEPVGGTEKAFKEPRPKPVKKKSRLIIRNLSFKVTEEKLKEYFEKFGDVKDINILKKPNGKLVGCAFVQYQNIFQAAKAIKELNLKPFLGRPIAIDWALPKTKYQTDEEKSKGNVSDTPEDTPNGQEDETIVIKDEPESEMDENSSQVDPYEHFKEEPMDIDEVKDEPQVGRNMVSKRKLKSEESDDDDEEDDDDEMDSSSEVDEKGQTHDPKRRKQLSNDVEEGKTLFIRNLSFDTTEEELKQFFEKFGQLHYALLCKDSLTEHPKGTGFVKFQDKSAADKCLDKYKEEESEFKLSRRQFHLSLALSKEKLGSKSPVSERRSQEEKKKADIKPKSDGRNLFLVREGFVRPGSAAAADVSGADMNKRASLHQVKKQMLKNLNIFISPTRLCVHNLPPTFSDAQLRKLFAKHAGVGAKITEAKIMRDMKDIDLNGKGKSKGYGFVNFTEHEHALVALRSVNNNPSVFKPSSRPIVEFSLENRMALKAKEKRALRSKEKNPTAKLKKQGKQTKAKEEGEIEQVQDEEGEQGKRKKKNRKKNKETATKQTSNKAKMNGDTGEGEQVAPKFAGLVAKKGVQTIPSFKPKGKITRNSLKQNKSKKGKKMQERKQRERKVPSKRPVERIDKTEKIISKYKEKLEVDRKGEGKRKKKWFQ